MKDRFSKTKEQKAQAPNIFNWLIIDSIGSIGDGLVIKSRFRILAFNKLLSNFLFYISYHVKRHYNSRDTLNTNELPVDGLISDLIYQENNWHSLYGFLLIRIQFHKTGKGECDFILICEPDVPVLEVKGGFIANHWTEQTFRSEPPKAAGENLLTTKLLQEIKHL